MVKLWGKDDEAGPGPASTSWILWRRDGWTPPEPSSDGRMPDVPEPAPPPNSTTRPPRDHARSRSSQGSARSGRRRARAAQSSPECADAVDLVNSIIDNRTVELVYQPVFDAVHGEIVGLEALTRGPEGPLRSPTHLFAAARKAGRAGELDWICRAAAFRAAMDADLHPSVSLFVNVEPDSLIAPCPEDLLSTVWEAETRLRVLIDMPARALIRHPLEVLESVRRARAAGWGVSLDELEFSSAARALLPTLDPDVIRLNHPLLRDMDSAGSALEAALTESERAGSVILMQMIEDASGQLLGRTVGAGYEQGNFLASPGPLPAFLPAPRRPLPLRASASTGTTPWDVVSASPGRPMASGVDSEGLDRLIRHLTTRAAHAVEPPVIAVVISTDRGTSPAAVAGYRSLLNNVPLTFLIGKGADMHEDWRTRTAEVPPGHLLERQVCVLGLSSKNASVMVAQPTGTGSMTWDVVMSHDPLICRAVMRELLHHLDRLAGGVWHAAAHSSDPGPTDGVVTGQEPSRRSRKSR